MLTEVYMPKNGMDMTEGTLIRWLKRVGDSVEAGEPIMEIETDKVTMEAEAPASGILLQRLHQEGDVVPVLEAVGYIGQPGDKLPENTQKPAGGPSAASLPQPQDTAVPDDGRILATPRAKALAKAHYIDLHTLLPSGRTGIIHSADVERALFSQPKATPLARRIAESLGADLAQIQGSGLGGKIVKADILAACAAKSAPPQQPPAEPASQDQLRMSPMRRVISKRMQASHRDIPPVTTAVKVDMTELLRLREHINQSREAAVRISVNDLIIKAVGQTLRRHERFRMTVHEDYYTVSEQINIGVAVAVEEGLLVPVVKNAGNLTVSEISQEVKRLADQARRGILKPENLGGACITISNLGMYGTYAFTPIINQPEASIIGVCAVEDELSLVEGQVSVRKKMILCTTYDHRIINGAEASMFQADLKAQLENPIDILL